MSFCSWEQLEGGGALYDDRGRHGQGPGMDGERQVVWTQALGGERQVASEMFATEDADEGPRAFMEKRAPAFHAR